jgi:hypothetical protein
MFPNDAKTISVFTPASEGTVCPVILEASSNARTLLQGVIITDGANLGKIKIANDTETYLDNNRLEFVSLASPVKFQNKAIVCERANNKPFQFTITYLDYDLTTQATNLVIEHPTNPEQNFVVQKTYTYGDITTIFALGLIAFFLIFYVLKRIFIHEETSIHSYQTKF